MTTLATLERVVRAKPIERDLVCPRCGGQIILEAGTYGCVTAIDSFGGLCAFTTETLADLKAVPRGTSRRVSMFGYEPDSEEGE